jgi:uncharacterized protein (TIGR02444 family)
MAGEAKGEGEPAGAAFWRFSLALYARPGVAAALLALQDGAGRDVNLMLFLLWLGAVGARRLDRAGVAAAAAAIGELAGAVGELRALRRRLRPAQERPLQALRRRIAALELAGERSVQCRLAAEGGTDPAAAAAPQAKNTGDRLATAAANLDLYLGAAAGAPEAALLRRALAGLMRQSAE